MCIKREKKQLMKGVGERKTYINNIEEKISTMYVYKMVTIPHVQKEQKKYIISSLHPSKRKR